MGEGGGEIKSQVKKIRKMGKMEGLSSKDNFFEALLLT